MFLFLKNFFFPFELESLPRAGKPTKSWQQCDIERVRKKVPVADSHFSGQLLPLWRRSVCPEGRGKGTNRTCSRQQDQTKLSELGMRHIFVDKSRVAAACVFIHASPRGFIYIFPRVIAVSRHASRVILFRTRHTMSQWKPCCPGSLWFILGDSLVWSKLRGDDWSVQHPRHLL